MIWGYFAASAALALIYGLRYAGAAESAARSFAKTGATLLLAGLALAGGAPWLVVLALLACAAGDWLLSRPGEGAFLAGVGAFALGHLAFVAAMLAHPASSLERLLTPPTAQVAMGLMAFGAAMSVLLWRKAGALRVAVVAYVPVILAMGLAALSLPALGALELVLAGAALFMVSDTLLAFEKFILPEAAPLRRVTPFAVWSSYWAAVSCLALGFALPV